jgi:hypothetical protein
VRSLKERDENGHALFRAQKTILKLREEKYALLDRVLLLEAAAGLAPGAIGLAEAKARLDDRERQFTRLNPPPLPFVEDRFRALPLLTTVSDFTSPAYNQSTQPPHAPASLPPRLRSHHLTTTIAAKSLEETRRFQRVARGLPQSKYAATVIFGPGEVAARPVRLRREKKQSEDKRAPAESRSTSAKPPAHQIIESPVPVPDSIKALNLLPNPFSISNPFESPPPQLPPIAAIPVFTHPSPLPSPAFSLIDMPRDFEPDDYHILRSRSPSTSDDGGMIAKSQFKTIVIGGATKPSRPKTSKTSDFSARTHSVPHISRNEDGSPILPIVLGVTTLRKLGCEFSRLMGIRY